MAIPKEPRQLMINLMYLVLTALLALNVSREVLNAFANINKSIGRSNSIVARKNTRNATVFADELAKGKAKDPAKIFRMQTGDSLSKELSRLTAGMLADLNGYRANLIQEAGGKMWDKEVGDSVLKRPEDIDASTRYMVEKQRKGEEMRQKLQAYMSAIVALKPKFPDSTQLTYSPGDSAELKSRLPINEDNANVSDKDWAHQNFFQVPAIGAATLIDKYVNDVHTSQGMVLEEIYAAVMGETYTKVETELEKEKFVNERPEVGKKVDDNPSILPFDTYMPIVQPSANYVLPNEKFTAKIMVGAYKAKDNRTTITVNGKSIPVINGIATYEEIAGGEGEKKLAIGGSYFDPNKNGGSNVPLSNGYSISYFVGAPGATISLDKMNVFYREVDNPITTSASGILLSNLRLAAPAGVKMTPNGTGSFIVDVTDYKEREAIIGLTGLRGDGQSQDFGGRKYRIKDIPNPIIKVANKAGGTVGVNLFRAQLGPFAVLENFDFDAKFTILDFTFSYNLRKNGEYNEVPNNGPLFNPQVKEVMARLKPKDKVYLENIRVLSPRGKVRNIPGSVTFTMVP
jgi:hypothetical protein